MANINEILARAAALRDETALNSISPERAGGIMYDTLIALNELWLQQGAALVISKIYASVAAMEADTAPVSDLTGKPLRPGQIVVIASSDSDNGSVYRYNGTESPSWSLVGSIGNLEPVDSLDSDSTTLPLAAHQGKVLDGKISQLGQEIIESIGRQEYKGITSYVSVPCYIQAGKKYVIQKTAGTAGVATRATSGGQNIDVLIPVGHEGKYNAEFTASADANFLRITANEASDIVIFSVNGVWNSINNDYKECSFVTNSYTSFPYKFVSGKKYIVEIISGSARVFTRDSADTQIVESIISDVTQGYYKTEFVAASDAYFVRIAAGSLTQVIVSQDDSIHGGTLKAIDNIIGEKIKELKTKEYSISDFTANTYFNLPTSLGAAISMVPASSSVGNATIIVRLNRGECLYLKGSAADMTRTFGYTINRTTLNYLKDSCLNGFLFSAEEDGDALITIHPSNFSKLILFKTDVVRYVRNFYAEDIYCPYPQLPADDSNDSDFNSETVTTSDIYNFLDGLATKYPDLFYVETLGKDATNTYDIKRYVVGDKRVNVPLKTIFIGANEHGPSSDPREGAIIACRLIKDLCESGCKTNKYLNILKKYFRFVIIPVQNPYGFNNNTRQNGNDVNINRNYDTPGWSTQTDVDKGASAGSEVETQYIMNTINYFKPQVALDLHCLGYTDSSNDNKCHYSGKITDVAKLNQIIYSMKTDYNLTCSSYGDGDFTTKATGDAYFNYKGIQGLLLEFQARDGVTGDSELHTARIMEANYTFLLRILNMLISNTDESLDFGMFI